MRDLVIIGAGGFGREVRDLALCMKAIDNTRTYKEVYNYTDAEFSGNIHPNSCTVIVAIGDVPTRKGIVARLREQNWDIIIHPSVMLSVPIIGAGTIICSGGIISTAVQIGYHVHINFACTIGHDCIIGDFVTISPGVHISGNVTIGDEVFIGTGAVIREKLTIGEGATIGMGAVVVKDVPPGVTVVGNPAREINEMSRRLYWPIRSKKAQAEPVAYENNQNNESGFLNPLLLAGVEDGYISYDGEKRRIRPDDEAEFMELLKEHRA